MYRDFSHLYAQLGVEPAAPPPGQPACLPQGPVLLEKRVMSLHFGTHLFSGECPDPGHEYRGLLGALWSREGNSRVLCSFSE